MVKGIAIGVVLALLAIGAWDYLVFKSQIAVVVVMLNERINQLEGTHETKNSTPPTD